MKERIIAGIVYLVLFSQLQAIGQTGNERRLTLKQCVDAAINNNLQVRQGDLQMQTSAVSLKQAKSNVLPDLFGNLGHGFNQGRSIDPFTNSYINQQILFASYSLGSSVVLFNGFQLKNLIKQNSLSYEANKMDLQQIKDNVTLNVILAYVQILNNEEQFQQSLISAEVTRKQVQRLTVMHDAGAIPPAQLYDLRGQLATDELTIVNNRNVLNAARLSLAQLMNVPFASSLAVERVSVDSLALQYNTDPKALYEASVRQLAIVKAAELRTQSATKGVQVAKGIAYPTVGLNGSFNTNYSNAATRDIFVNSQEIASGDYVSVGGSKVPVITTRPTFTSQKIGYGDQFNNNYNTSLFLSIQVPILNRSRAKNRIALAKIDLKNAQVVAETVKTQLSQNIEEAYFNMTAASEKYQVLQRQVDDFSESYRTAEVRFNAGAINQIDYLIAKNNVDRARANSISTRYDYIFRLKILDYYQGRLSL
ncbi:TolC family protein [Segetibacter sp.]|uniref:TolC family protein n=1 Tax=Segetibacter sp. TaxID=2231182 RepID=UPI002627D215|nr:TolC family protein [Segetibacter sp.]MCW3078774.1 TolC family protein [Segetibacter sp.]